MDNFSFRYLCARKKGIRLNPDDHPVFVEAWEKSWNECHRLIRYISSLKPHEVKNTSEVNQTRRYLSIFMKPITEMTERIQVSSTVIFILQFLFLEYPACCHIFERGSCQNRSDTHATSF